MWMNVSYLLILGLVYSDGMSNAHVQHFFRSQLGVYRKQRHYVLHNNLQTVARFICG